MTTIAWDGHTLAADQASWSGGCKRRVRKVFRIAAADGQQFLVGFTGNGSFCMAVLAWMRGERERPDALAFMPATELPNQCALVIDEKRRPWLLGNELQYTLLRERVAAMGAGQDYAWGALEAGATAVQAVRIAIKRSDWAGLGVDAVRFA
jgi:hypothetical protein